MGGTTEKQERDGKGHGPEDQERPPPPPTGVQPVAEAAHQRVVDRVPQPPHQPDAPRQPGVQADNVGQEDDQEDCCGR